ncbi:hypothetical protein Ahy_A02g006344 [Arachis hypogaea]|uniref:Uncharacterized protein n=1 Tax=Arachis hypogaea TaxID=3818 RepID=A0A445E9L6_ARAHY|nr:hypothetical protein Ahy_A02g006344 [Arachis hypogaea]
MTLLTLANDNFALLCLSQFGPPQSLWDGAYLNLYGMGLTKSIPKEIGTLTKLSYLDLSHNYLNGKLLLTLCKMRDPLTYYLKVLSWMWCLLILCSPA